MLQRKGEIEEEKEDNVSTVRAVEVCSEDSEDDKERIREERTIRKILNIEVKLTYFLCFL